MAELLVVVEAAGLDAVVVVVVLAGLDVVVAGLEAVAGAFGDADGV
jgi:hypothetical protein